nr:12019_t:CDS:10 [Entrophospora candida]
MIVASNTSNMSENSPSKHLNLGERRLYTPNNAVEPLITSNITTTTTTDSIFSKDHNSYKLPIRSQSDPNNVHITNMTATEKSGSTSLSSSPTHNNLILEEKKSVSFPPTNIITSPSRFVILEDEIDVIGESAVASSANEVVVAGSGRSSSSSSKRRPNSMIALNENQNQNLPQRSFTSPSKSKKLNYAFSDGESQIENYSSKSRSGGNNRKGMPKRRSTVSEEYFGEGGKGINFDEETQKKAEIVKRRLSKMKRPDKPEDNDEMMIGTRIGVGHVNFVLMYNMLTGIRVGVSRCNAKMHRDLDESDFKAAHKFSFDITGNELTPSAKYDFKFKDYAPWVFRHLREFFHIDAADYLVSLTSEYILSELNSPGKNTLLSRFYGLHRIKLPRGSKIHFVVMNNIFPPHRDIHETYDLKGSTVGREFNETEAAKNPRSVLKDLNWLNREKRLELGPEKRKLFVEQLQKDVHLLQHLNIMDYSLLIGLHYTSRGNKDSIRQDFFVFQPHSENSIPTHKRESKASKLRKLVGQADPVKLDQSTTKLVLDAKNERKNCVFYMDDGGFRATDEQNNPTQYIYYLGVIDILTPYNTVKKVEHAWRALNNDKKMISAVNPDWYGQRFLDFMFKAIKHNDVKEEDEEL